MFNPYKIKKTSESLPEIATRLAMSTKISLFMIATYVLKATIDSHRN